MTTLENLVEEFKRQKLAEILSQCSVPQQEFFKKIFGDKVSSDKLYTAYDLCERTIKKNIKDLSKIEVKETK
jgi:hypothetical protein